MDSRESLIPNNLGGTENFFNDLPLVGAVEFQDGLIAVIPVIGFLLLSGVIPESQSQLRLVFIAVGGLVSLLALLIKPDYLTLSEYMSVYREYQKSDKNFSKELNKSAKTVKVNEDPDTRNKIGVNRIYPEYNVVEREDGVMLTMIQLSGVDIEILGTQNEWTYHANKFTDVLNGSIDEDIQIYMPMRQYDPTAQVSKIEERSNDTEINSDPLLSWYALDRINFHQGMAENGFYRKYYVIIKTHQSEVVTDSAYQQTGIPAVLDNIPISGLKEIYTSIRDIQFGILSPREIQNKQLNKANEKATKYKSYFDGPAGGDAEVISGNRAGIILKEFWEGQNISEAQEENYLREQPYVMGPSELQNNGDNNE